MKTFTFQAIRTRWETWRLTRLSRSRRFEVQAYSRADAWGLAMKEMRRLVGKQHARMRLYAVPNAVGRRGRRS